MSITENTTNDLRFARMLMKKIGETFQDFQSHSYSILTLGEQWRSLQNSIGTIHNSVEERVKAVESKEREFDMNWIRLQNFKTEVEVRQKKLKFEENFLQQRIEVVEMREKQVKEWCECLELQRREVADRAKAVEVAEERGAQMDDQCRDCREKMSKFGKNAVKGKEKSKEDKSKPSDDELRNAISDILKQVDFNAATLTDILNQIDQQFITDLTSRRSLIKLMVQDELTKATLNDILKQLAKQFITDLTSRRLLIKLMVEDEVTKLLDDADDDDEGNEGETNEA